MINEWKLPSATCPRIEKGKPDSLSNFSDTATACASFDSGTAASVLMPRFPGCAAIPAQ